MNYEKTLLADACFDYRYSFNSQTPRRLRNQLQLIYRTRLVQSFCTRYIADVILQLIGGIPACPANARLLGW